MPSHHQRATWRGNRSPRGTEESRAALPTRPSGATYSLDDWDADAFASFGEGRDPASCPECGRTAFYGPRIDAADRRYRQCRFCGFTQTVDEPAVRYVATVHACASWPECARAPYVWWVAPWADSYPCPFCRQRVDVSPARVQRPVDEPKHPWWRVPQDRRRSYYFRFWENWPVTHGRVYL